jgi:hypothetical protein
MNRVVFGRLVLYGLAAVLVLFLSGATIGVSREVLDVDLSPLIDRSAQYPTRFAVEVPHPVSIEGAGSWTQNGTASAWTYAIRIPGAVSMSFHASMAYVPPTRVLKVAGSRVGLEPTTNGLTVRKMRSRDFRRRS